MHRYPTERGQRDDLPLVHRLRALPDTASGSRRPSTTTAIARWLLGSELVFYLRPVSTNPWIVSGLFGALYETQLVVTVLRLPGATGFLASHLLLSRRIAARGNGSV